MGYSVRGVSNIAATSSPQTLTLPVTTNAGDCIVIAGSAAGSLTPVGSGAGATWNAAVATSTAPKAYLIVGYNCSSGQTTCTLTGFAAGSLVVTVISGVKSSGNPVQQTQTAGGSSGSSWTTPSLTYTAGSLLVGVSSQYTGTPPPTITWSNGDTNTNAGSENNNARPVSFDYTTDASSTSTTFKAAWGNTSSGGVVVVALSPGATTVAGTGSETVTVAAVGAGAVGVPATASQTISVTATATGAISVAGTASETVNVSGSATGVVGLAGTASETITITAAAGGAVGVPATVSQTISVTATATGLVVLPATASQTATVIATATGSVGLAGTGASDISVTATAVGTVEIPVIGTGTVGISVTATATGAIERPATGTVTVGVTARAVGTVAPIPTLLMLLAGPVTRVQISARTHLDD